MPFLQLIHLDLSKIRVLDIRQEYKNFSKFNLSGFQTVRILDVLDEPRPFYKNHKLIKRSRLFVCLKTGLPDIRFWGIQILEIYCSIFLKRHLYSKWLKSELIDLSSWTKLEVKNNKIWP